MKKRAVGLLSVATLAFCLFGCGNAAEPKQEEVQEDVQEVQQETKQEEVKTDAGTEQEETVTTEQKDDREFSEYEYFFSTDKLDLDNTIPCDLSDMSPNGEYCGNWELSNSINMYAERDGKACVIGYTKENIPVNVFNSCDEWITLYFENETSPNDYKLIKVEDFLASSNYSTQPTSEEETETEVEQETEEMSPQDEIFEKAGYDKNKTYTEEEYIKVLTKIFEEMGKTYNEDVVKEFNDSIQNKTEPEGYHMMMAYYDIDFSDSEDILQNTKNAISYIEGGLDGMSDIVEFSIGKGTSNGKETINVYVKVKN